MRFTRAWLVPAALAAAGCGDGANVESSSAPAPVAPAPVAPAPAAPAPGTHAADIPEDPAAFVEAVKSGKLPPIAPWKRWDGTVKAPPFGARPMVDPGNPIPPGKEAWGTPVEGGTLVVQYNSAPKNINKVVSNDAVVEYVTNTVRPYLIHQDMVDFSYGRPEKDGDRRSFVSVNPRDCATRWVKEDTLARPVPGGKAGELEPLAHGVVTEADDSWVVAPLALVAGEKRETIRIPKKPGDRVLRETFVTVWMKEGVRWHDGAPLRAADVAFSVRAIKNKFVNSDNVKPYFELVKSCDAVGDLVVRWVLDRQYFLADDTTVGQNLIVLPEHAYRALWAKAFPDAAFDPGSQDFAKFFNNCTELNERPLGTGPYRVTGFAASQSVTLERYDGYHGPRPFADRIVWRFINDPLAAVQALKSGEIDFAAHGPTEELYSSVMADEAFQRDHCRAAWFTPAMGFVAFNRKSPCKALADNRVRAALGMLMDRPGFLATKLHNLAVLVSGDQFVSGTVYDHAVPPLAYDPAAAEQLLDEAGWYDRDGDGIRDRDGKKLEFTFCYPTASATLASLTPLWLDAAKKAGIAMKVQTLEWAQFVEALERKKFDAMSLQWAMEPENDPHQLWHSAWAPDGATGSNVTSYSDPRADALIEAIQQCLEPEERRNYHRALHRLLDEDAGYTFLWCRPELAGWNRKWRGVRLYPKRPGFDLTEWYMPKEHQERRK
jgi:peptide/nickel transport system substrate-binding protein